MTNEVSCNHSNNCHPRQLQYVPAGVCTPSPSPHYLLANYVRMDQQVYCTETTSTCIAFIRFILFLNRVGIFSSIRNRNTIDFYSKK